MLTQELLKQIVYYDPETGIFTSLINSRYIRVGDTLGYQTYQGYKCAYVSGKHYRLHRLAWFYVYGYWPKEIDHIDRDRSNNAISNLRDVSRAENLHNTGVRPSNTSGTLGVSWSKYHQKWEGRVTRYGKLKTKLFHDKQDAIDWREDFLRAVSPQEP